MTLIGDGLKPEPWLFDRRLVAPEWEWFWKTKPTFVLPNWEGGAAPVDLVTKKASTITGTPDWQVSTQGLRRRFIGTEYDTIAVPPPFTYPFTMIVYVDDPIDLSGSQANYYMGLVDTGSGNRMIVLIGDATAGWRYFVRNGGSFQQDNFIAIQGGTPSKGPHMLVGTSRSDGDNEFFVDGLSIGTSTKTCSTFGANLQLDIGILNDSSPNTSTNAGVIWAAWLPYGLYQGQARQLYLDPFGPFRMDVAKLSNFFVPAAAPAGGLPPAQIGFRGSLGGIQIDGGMIR